MKIFKGKYGWSTSAHSKNVMGEQVKCYMDVTFKKGEEPLIEEVEGKLYFRQDDGSERECFISSYEKRSENGKVVMPKLVMLSATNAPKKKMDTRDGVQTALNDGHRDMFGKNVDINPDELPFY